MMTCKPGDIVEVPFPFVDMPVRKRRPALVISDERFNGSSGVLVLAMITSAERSRWDSDVILDDWKLAGLRKASIICWKIFTLDKSLVLARRGSLSPVDRARGRESLHSILSDWL